MRRRRLTTLLAVTAGALLMVLGLSGPAYAVDLAQKLAVLSSWTQTSTASYDSWNTARQNQGAWVAYGFDWSTDLCSNSPDNPLGFDFRLSCHRHDFGYRNYKAVGQFSANKSRLDDAFYAESPDWTEKMSSIGLLNVEMEASAMYVVARQRGLRAGMICAVSSNLVAGTSVYDDEAHRRLAVGWGASVEAALDAIVELGL